jgi:hypothetical protein
MDLDLSQAFERPAPELCKGALFEHESRTILFGSEGLGG